MSENIYGQQKLAAFFPVKEPVYEPLKTTREERGRLIAGHIGNIRRIDDAHYEVKGQSIDGFYKVDHTEIGWVCSCPDHKSRGVKCKHIWAVEISYHLREQIRKVRIAPLTEISCPDCRSLNTVKRGIRHNKYGDLQRYACLDCGKRFSINTGFEGMKSTPEIITTAMQLYFSGESLRNTAKTLKIKGVKVSHVSVYKWIEKYTQLMNEYLEKITPNVGDTWRADEDWIKVRGVGLLDIDWLLLLRGLIVKNIFTFFKKPTFDT